MLKVNKELPTTMKFRVGPKMGPKGASPLEQKLYRMGYRCFYEKIEDVKVSSRRMQKVRVRRWYRGKQCITLKDILNNIRKEPTIA